MAGIDVRDEYNRLVYRNGTRQQYALNLSGGSSNSSWYFSSGFDQNRSELQAGYNRVNLNFQNSWKPLKGLRLDVGLAYTKSNTRSGQQGLDVELEPYTQLADANGNPLAVPRSYRKPYLDTLGRGKLLNWNYYPLLANDQQETNLNLNSTVLNAGLNYAPLNWISLDLKYQYENQNSNSNTLYGKDSYFARSLINQYATLSTNAVKFNIPVGAILDLDKNTLDVHNLRAQLNLSKEWGKHRVAALAGSEVRERALSGNTNRTYGYNTSLNTGLLYDPVGTYPHIISGLASIIPSNANFNDANNRYVSGFANTAYTYADRYTVSGSARKDASNLFGLNTNDKWNVLWSAGLAWTINKESFYRLDAVPDLKLRATYGYSGNVDPGRSALTTILYAGQTVYTGVPFATIQQFGNPDLRWEKVRMVNLALDFRSENDILYGSIDIFSKKSTDLYGPTELDYTTGAGTTITRNVAQVSGKGFDLELYSKPLKGKLSWTTNLNLSGYRDEVVNYYAGSSFTLATAVTSSAPSFSRVVGTPLYAMYSYKWGGLDPVNGDPYGYLNGVKSKSWSAIVNSSNLNDLVYSGSAIPTIYGSFVNTLRYQKLALSFSVLYKFGYYFRRNTISYGTMLTTPRATHQDYLSRWQKPGDELITQIPSFTYPVTSSRESIYSFSEQTVEKGDNIRLAYVNLDYTLKGRWMAPFKDIHVFFNASNLGILWRANRYGIDPDVAQGSTLRGKSFALGIKTNL